MEFVGAYWCIVFGIIVGILNFSNVIVDKLLKKRSLSLSLSTEIMQKRMGSVSVCTISDYSKYSFNAQSAVLDDRFVEFFFFDESDALHYARQFPGGYDLRILRLPLAHIFRADELFHPSIGLVPELSQLRNALEIQEKGKDIIDVPFSGVPVFQADGYICQNGEDDEFDFRPLFLRKEDLEMSLAADPDFTKPYDIQVFALEDIMQSMRDSSTSEWNDVCFIGPGLTFLTWSRRLDLLN